MGSSLGDLQHLALLAVLRLGEEAYGVSVRDEIREIAGRDLSLGAVYSTLRRLRGQGLLSACAERRTPDGSGRRRRYFELTPRGQRALEDAQREIRNMVRGLPDLPLGWRGRGEAS